MALTLVVSDLHLGAVNCHTAAIAELLERPFDRLILNGDTFDHIDLRRFRPAHWRIIDKLRTLGERREIILIRGNHDAAPADDPHTTGASVVGRMLGRPMVEDYALTLGSRSFLVTHGDRFDSTMRWTWTAPAADQVYRLVQRCHRGFAKWLKACSKQFLGVVPEVRRGALHEAARRGLAGAIIGHTHFCEDSCDPQTELRYINTGCWVENPCTYLEISGLRMRMRRILAEPRSERRRASVAAATLLPVGEPHPELV